MITKFDNFSLLLESLDNLSLEDTLSRIKKDKELKPLFKSDTKVDDVQKFYSTLNYLFYNNRSVMNFFKKRDSFFFERMRKKTVKDYQENIDFILSETKDLISTITKEINRISKSKLSASTKKELLNYVNSTRHRNFSYEAKKEILNTPSLRPQKPIKLYRGMLFKKGHFENGFSGQKNFGTYFLDSIKKGTDIVDINLNRESSWTYSEKVAEGFARYSAASSHNAAMMGWFQREIDKRAIDGELGVILSVLARPENIVIDMNMLESDIGFFEHGNESEVILDSGKYICRIVKAWDKGGEIDMKKYFDKDEKTDQYQTIYNKLESINFDQLPLEEIFNKKFLWYYQPPVDDIKEVYDNFNDYENKYNKVKEQLDNIFTGFEPKTDFVMLDEETQKKIKLINWIHQSIKPVSESDERDIKKQISSFYESNEFAHFIEKQFNKTKFSIKRYDYTKKQEWKNSLATYMGCKDYYDWTNKIYPTFVLIKSVKKMWEISNKLKGEERIRF